MFPIFRIKSESKLTLTNNDNSTKTFIYFKYLF